MVGLGFSGIIDNFSLKGDFAYFQTDDNINNILDSTLYREWNSGVQEIKLNCEELNETSSWNPIFQPIDCDNYAQFNNSQVIDNSAEYLQYTFELEYAPTYDFRIISQFSVSDLLNIGKADSIRTSRGTIMFNPLDYFIPGIGLSNTFISEKSLAFILQKTFSEIDLECQMSTIIDLDKKGSINEISGEYQIYDNIKLLIALNKILYNKNIQMNPFAGMEDFSHIRMELKYYY